MADSEGKNLKIQGNQHAGVDLLRKGRRSTENYVPEDKCVDQGPQKCTRKRGTSTTKFTGGPALLAGLIVGRANAQKPGVSISIPIGKIWVQSRELDSHGCG